VKENIESSGMFYIVKWNFKKILIIQYTCQSQLGIKLRVYEDKSLRKSSTFPASISYLHPRVTTSIRTSSHLTFSSGVLAKLVAGIFMAILFLSCCLSTADWLYTHSFYLCKFSTISKATVSHFRIWNLYSQISTFHSAFIMGHDMCDMDYFTLVWKTIM
jgi:hypothetical protein